MMNSQLMMHCILGSSGAGTNLKVGGGGTGPEQK